MGRQIKIRAPSRDSVQRAVVTASAQRDQGNNW